MFDHVTLRVSDRDASERFYRTVLSTLGMEPTYVEDRLAEWDDFSISPADAEHPVTRGLHVGFVAPSREHVDTFHRAGVEAGHRDDGAPGPRPQYREDYYGSFLLDPDGNSAEAVHHGGTGGGGNIDHLWIRVADVGRARAFYEVVAPHGGFRLREARSDYAHFVGQGGSFSLAAGSPTEHVHLAFPVTEDATVDAFHAAAVAAGHRDNGVPGERAVHHPGHYGAFVLDPDGNNVEVVNHNRRSVAD